ncbi:MAG: primosomal protein N' [Deltaproteobacteria bacterium CG11_big_fil_rev_8_21_14_0_20_45_16]|nr:MAG: primosomal protein N' [Deltaproteobacteria bacterium CG11_big_fil_rev_8_21_14_0_20_45_16]
MLYEVAIKTPLRRLFTYESAEALEPGSRVSLPFRSKDRIGFVWRQTIEAPKGLRAIHQSLDQIPIFDAASLQFYETASHYYGISLGELLHSSVPKAVRDGKPIPTLEPKHFVSKLADLSELQKTSFEAIHKSFGRYENHLLLGDTGSGKTEIYLHLIDQALMEGLQVLMLVPEISLTPQLEQRLAERLGSDISVFHSNLKESRRLESFASAWQARSDIFLGARSALFLPYRKLGLIIIDEEHDASYKQSERGTYQARDLALLRAKILNIPVVLGSATPSIETYQRMKDSKPQQIYRLPKFFEAPKPQVEIVDLRETWKGEEKSFITKKLHDEISQTLGRAEQALLFLNRRGSASQRICVSCGHIDECEHCSARLTMHFDVRRAICHLCGFQKTLDTKCEKCSAEEFFNGGIGTKELESQVAERFPEARVARLDRDQALKRNEMERILKAFAGGKIDILVGTQMISKGIDISKLSLIGVVLADQGWSVPDFRAGERSFQLLYQLMGRAGRRGQASKMLIQTFRPEYEVLKYLVVEGAYESFAKKELELRSLLSLPPFSRQILWTLSDQDESKLMNISEGFVRRIKIVASCLGVEIFGPVPAPLSRWKSLYRVQVLAKSKAPSAISALVRTVLEDLEARPLEVKIKTDRDPYHFM